MDDDGWVRDELSISSNGLRATYRLAQDGSVNDSHTTPQWCTDYRPECLRGAFHGLSKCDAREFINCGLSEPYFYN